MITCDLCGKAKECLQKEIDSKEYDICSECWDALAQRLKGKGRVKPREMVLLPTRTLKEQEEEMPQPLPGEPPVIQGEVHPF
jgi:ribosome-binding protein aMBF1 (putative translation factor)